MYNVYQAITSHIFVQCDHKNHRFHTFYCLPTHVTIVEPKKSVHHSIWSEERSMAAEQVQHVRELEKLVISDTKNANSLIAIRKQLEDEDNVKDVRMAALHSLRRIFVHFLDTGRFSVTSKDDKDKGKKLDEFRKWLVQQLSAFQENLHEYIANNDSMFQAPAIRTLLEFVRRDHLLSRSPTTSSATFGVRTYQAMLEALLSVDDIDFDVIIMLREEVFSKPDCAFYAMLIVRNLLHDSLVHRHEDDAAKAAQTLLIKNCLDILRFLSVPSDEESLRTREDFLVQSDAVGDDGMDDGESSGDEDEDNDGNAITRLAPGKAGRGMKRVMDASSSSNSSSSSSSNSGGAKKQKRLSRAEQLVTLSSHRRVFSRVWLVLLALPLNSTQHKLVLKHIPEHVIGVMTQPLLLADYLTQSYQQGGVVAVLALESLFELIVKYNLDYPNFFASLYRLCTTEVLSAKYRGKFMKLLTMCLRSANMPAYLVAAFAKRLSQLSLRVPSPSALYCVAQVTWLLRKHPQCLVMIHRRNKGKGSTDGFVDEYDPTEEHDLEKANALQSSLWELGTLARHHLHTVATFATAVQAPASTADSMDAPNLAMDDFLDHSYASLIETGVKLARKNAAFAFVPPSRLIAEDDLIAQCFGSSK